MTAGGATGGEILLHAGFGGTVAATNVNAQTIATGGVNSDFLASPVRSGDFTLSADSATFAIDGSLIVQTTARAPRPYNDDVRSGDITISVSGDGSDVPASFVGADDGQVDLNNDGAGGAAIGNILISNTVGNGAGPLELRGDVSLRSFGFVTNGAVTRFVSDGGRIHATNNLTIYNYTDTLLDATGAGGLDVDGSANFISRNFRATHQGNENGVDTFFAQNGYIYAYDDFVADPGTVLRGDTSLNVNAGYDLTADYLRANDALAVTAQHSLQVRDVAALVTVQDGQGNSDPTRGTVSLSNAYNGGSPSFYTDGALNIGIPAVGNTPAIAGSVTAPGNITIQSGTSIYTQDNTQIVGGNAVTIQAGDDIRLAGVGGAVRSGTQTQIAGHAGLAIGAGALPVDPSVDAPGNVRALIVDAALSDGAGGTITLSGDAIQADAGSITTGGDVTARLVNGDDGAGVGTGATPLRSECGDGTVCFGALNAGGTVSVGSFNSAETPTLVRFRQSTSDGAFDVRAGAIRFGDDPNSPITIQSSGNAAFTSTIDTIAALSPTSLISGGSLLLSAKSGIDGATLDATNAGDLTLISSGPVTLGNLHANGALLGGDGSAVVIGGAFAATSLSTGGGDINLTADSIGLDKIELANDNNLYLTATSGDVTLGSAIGGPNGEARRIEIQGANITADRLGATDTILLNGTGAVTVMTDVNTGTVDAFGSSVELNSLGGLNIGQGSASGGAFNANAFYDLGFGSINGGVVQLNSALGGVSGDSVSGGTVVLGAAGSVRIGTDLSIGALYATGSDISVDSFSDYTVASATANSGDIHFGSAGSITVQQADAAANFDAAAGGTLALGTASAGGSLTGRGDQGVSFDDLAATSVDLSSSAGDVTGATIATPGAATLTAAGAVAVTDLTAHSVDAQGASVLLTAPGTLTITRVAASSGDVALTSGDTLNVVNTTATGAISATSVNGALQLNTLTAGGALTGRAATGIGFATIMGQSIDLETAAGPIAGTALRTIGTARLVTPGAIAVSDEVTANGVTAIGGSIALTQNAGALNITQANATAGDATLTSSGVLTLNNTTATDAIRATSRNETVQANGVVANGALIVRAATGVGFGTLGGANIDVQSTSGDFNIVNLTSPGTIRLVSGGRITVGNAIAAGGGITAQGLNADLRNNIGALNVTSVIATGGSISLTGRDGIGVANATATGSILGAAGTGASITAGTLNAGGQVLLNGTGVSFDSIAAGSIAIQGNTQAITGGRTVTTGDQRFMTTGAVAITNLGVGNVSTAFGSSVALSGNGPVSIDNASSSSGDVVLSAGGALNVNTASAGANLSATSTGGAVTAGTPAANGATVVNGATGVSFTSLRGATIAVQGGSGAITGGATTTTGTQTFQTAGALTVTSIGVGAATARGSSVALTGTGSVTVAGATATAGGVTLRGGGALTVTAADATGGVDVATTSGAVQLGTTSAGTTIKARAPGAIGFTRLTAGSVDLASSGGGDIAGARLGAGGAVLLDTGGAITVTQVDSGAVTAHGGSVALAAPGALNVVDASADGDGITLRSVGDLAIGSASARKFIDAASTGGALTVGSARIAAPVGTLALAPSTPATGAITLAAATSATLNGAVSATGPLDVTAATIALNGTSSGATASFRSAAIAVGNAAAVTSPGLVTFQNAGAQRTSIGGAPAGGYALSAAALDRVKAGSITVIAPAAIGGNAGGPDVTIGDLTLHGTPGTTTGNLGANGAFTVTTPGQLQVVGNLLLTDAGSGNAIRLSAGNGIGVTLPTGSVKVATGAGAPVGAIELVAPRIVIATGAAAADVAAAVTTAAKTARLAINDTGATSDAGGISADLLTFRVANGLYIQNTGGTARADRRGFTAGARGVDIIATGASPAEFVVNGVVGTTTGDAVLAALRLSGPFGQTSLANFIGGSGANGCTLDTGCPVPPPVVVVPPPVVVPPVTDPPVVVPPVVIPPVVVVTPPTIGVPAQDIVTAVVDATVPDELAIENVLRAGAPSLQAPLISLVRSQPFSFTVPIDEPVTGAGNDSLWTGVGVGTSGEGSGATTGTGNDDDDDAAPANGKPK